MKSIFKLTRGELKKIFKSTGVYIMTGILIAAIVLFAWLYETQLGGKSIFQTIMELQNVPDVFDILDGEADDIIGDNFDYATSIPGSEDLLTENGKFNDYFKMILVTNSLNELVTDMSGGTGIGGGETVNTADFGLIKTASAISVYYESSIKTATTDRNNAKSETEFLKNNGGYGKNYVDYIENLFVTFAKSWDAYKQAREDLVSDTNNAYNRARAEYIAVKDLESNLTEEEMSDMNTKPMAQWSYAIIQKVTNAVTKTEKYINLLTETYNFVDKSNAMMEQFNNISNYTELSFMNTKYLLYESSGFSPSAEGRNLSSSIKSFNKNTNNYVQLLEAYETLKSDVAMIGDLTTLSPTESLWFCVNKDFLRVKEKTASAIIDIDAFISESGTMISRQGWEGEFFSGFSEVKAADYGGKTDEYYMAVMKTQSDYLKASLKANITQEVYEKSIEPYIKVIEESDECLGEMIRIRDEFKALSKESKKADAAQMYKELKRNYKAYTSKVSTLRLLLQNVNLSNTVEALGYKDSQLTKIYGNQLFGSKYSIRATITESQYFISNSELSIDYVSATTLDKGYGYMNFAWMIIYILVLIFGIVIGAGQIAGEHASGTMKLLLIRPHKRWQVVLSKLLATMIVVAGFLIVAFLFSFVLGTFWGYGGAKTALLIFNSVTPIKMSAFWVMSLSYIFGFLEIFMYVLIALMVSTVFKSHAGAVSVSMLIYFLAMILTSVLGQFGWYKFVLFNNTNLFTYFSTGPSLNDMTFWFSLVVNIVYTALLLFASLFTFQKRDAT